MDGNGFFGKRILLCTTGSPGDLLPFLAIGRELRRRGHLPVLASAEAYRGRAEALDLGFAAVRPDRPPGVPEPDLARRVGRGYWPGDVFRRMFLPDLWASYEDTLAAASGCDLVLSHTLAFAAGPAAATLGVPWASAVVNPLGYFSRFDPPELGPSWLVGAARALGPGATGLALAAGRRVVTRWSAPWREVRAAAGLPPEPVEPVFAGQHSPLLALALFSPLLGQPQPDWPVAAVQTGFPFFEDPAEPAMADELREFLAAGPAPIVFTLGTTAVNEAGSFYAESAKAAAALGARAILLTGRDPGNVPPALPLDVLAVPYAPHGTLFAAARAVVHQGGVGTLSKAMRAGKPSLIVPFAHDQPDNAARAVRLGVARRLSRRRYGARAVEAELAALLADETMRDRAAHVGRLVGREDGAAVAADAIERLVARSVTHGIALAPAAPPLPALAPVGDPRH
jgi:UDP:flavonoid glycosyltransferase YjiC (YdhE family)